jgi:hypothetical protein
MKLAGIYNMDGRAKPLLIITGIWFGLFIFVIAGYSGNLGISAITGNVVNESGTMTGVGVQSLIIVVLFFTNLVTLFFLTREIAGK